MKRFKSLSLKNKRTLAIAGVALLGLTVVGTIAYNQDSMFFANLFRLQDDVAEFSETFDSPDDWQPCQEIPKTAIATNRNAKPRYVRMTGMIMVRLNTTLLLILKMTTSGS